MRYYVLLILVLSSIALKAQEINLIGETHTLYSENLQEERRMQVYLPSGYEGSDKLYPVLYILDGQWYFLNGVAIQQTLRGEFLLPEMIVVGVEMNRPHRDDVFRNQWNEFGAFIEQELVSYVDETFRTKDERILFGWETSAFLTCEIILSKVGAFDGAIASNGAYISEGMIASFDSLDQNRYLYLANTTKDIYTVPSSQQAAKTLEKADSKSLIWEYDEYNDEIHESLAYLSIYHGLKHYYHNFASLTFSSINEFYEKGGITFVRKYFQERGERFGLPTQVDDGTKNTLIWMAWRHDEFDAFDLFMTEFKDVLSTPRYASAYWQNRLAQFYLRYEAFDKAIPFFEAGISVYPEEKHMAALHAGLGIAMHEIGNSKQAKMSIKKAIEIAQSQDDPKLKEYQEQLKRVRN